MGIMIDEVSAEVESATSGTGAGEHPQNESAGRKESGSEIMLSDQINRLEKRQLRLLAD